MTHQRRATFTWIVVLFVAFAGYAGCLPCSAAEAPIAIEHVTVLPMTAQGNQPVRDATVLIRNGRIEAVAPTGSVKIPAKARRVNGTDKWLMPALADCHVHIENDRMNGLLLERSNLQPGITKTADILLPYVANGILQVMNMSAMPESVAQRNEVESGKVLGPHIALAAMVDGSPPIWPTGMTRVAATPEQGRQIVREIKAEGHDFVKTYTRLEFDTFDAIVDEAVKLRMKVLGHIPGRGAGMTEKYLRPGFAMVAHAEEFAFQSRDLSDAEIARYAQLAKKNGAWLTATLTVDERIAEQVRDPQTLKTRSEFRYVHPLALEFWRNHNPYLGGPADKLDALKKVIEFNRRLVKAFSQAGIPIVAGTDSLVPGVVPGFALHDELVALAAAGLTNEQVLAAATRLPAEWIGVAADRGTVERGKRADLILLDADPLADVVNTSKIAAVIAGGRYLSRAELDKMMADLAQRYAAMPQP